jgi:4-hydroxy-4-methyl-2-oxoglutarate aldolase
VTGAALSAASTHEALGRIGALPREIHSVSPGLCVTAPAFTVTCGAQDNLALHHAIAQAEPGTILVVQTGGWYDAGYFGDVMATASAARGILGLVIDGCVRDSADLAGTFPVWARGLSVKGTTKDPLLASALRPRLRFPGVDIDDGDLIVADDDGVVAVPSGRASEVATLVEAREGEEAEIRGRIADGETTVAIYQLPHLRDAPDPLRRWPAQSR